MSALTLRRSAAAVALAFWACALAPAAAHEFRLGSLEIQHPWSRATPPGATVASGYFIVRNRGAVADRLLSVSADIAARASIHEVATVDGMLSMRALKNGAPVEAGGELALKPGGFHVMFEDLNHPLKQGESFSGVLTFEKAGTIPVQFTVDAMGAAQPTGKPQAHDDH